MDFDYSTETITPDNTNLLTIGGTGGFELPIGTTAQRPVSGLDNGAMRYNTDLNVIEGYVALSWTPMATGSTSITLTGDITGSGTSPVATTLATVNANVGTFAVSTVNAKGLVTAASNLTGDITSTGGTTTLANVNSNIGTFTAVTVNAKGLTTAATNMSVTGDVTGTASGSDVALTLATVNSNVGQFAVATFNGKGLATAATNLSGDATSAGAVLTLATVNASPQADAFRKITVNGKGLVTATSAVTSSDITTALGYSPVNKAGDTMTGTLTMSGGSVQIVLPNAPVAGTDAANKNYVDAVAAGLSWKQSVRVATTANGTLATAFANGQTVDGIALVTGDRILIKNQTAQADNGIYVVQASGAPVRSTDADAGTELVGASVFVDMGTANADTGWVQTTNAPITIGTSNITWAQFSGSGSYVAGTGLSLAGNTFSLTSPVLATLGGTGQATYVVGDVLYASSASALSRLADVATGNSLISGGVGAAPSWGKVGLTTHVTGVLPVANGGSGLSTAPAAGQLLIGNGTTYTLSSLTAGSGISITPAAGSITVAATNNGTVTSVGLSLPGSVFTVSGSPVTASGTLTGSLATQSANTVFAGPTTGGVTAPTFRTLVFSDVTSAIQLYRETVSSPTTPVATGVNAVAIGSGASATGTSSYAAGAGSSASVPNISALANGSFATAGDAQRIRFVARNITTNSTPAVLFIDGSTQRLVLPNNSAWTFKIDVVARRTDSTGGYAMYSFTGGIVRDGTAATTSLKKGSRIIIDESSSNLNCSLSADTTNGALNINVTGRTGETYRWVATVEITQVTN